MKYLQLNNNWDADPNAPEPEVYIKNGAVNLIFYLNYHIYPDIKKGQRGQLTFFDCYMYRAGSPNDHGFDLNQFRYGPDDIKWGEFYELFESDWQNNFPEDKVIVKEGLHNDQDLKHFLFFFRDEGFECIAKDYKFEYLQDNEKFSGIKAYPPERPIDKNFSLPISKERKNLKILGYFFTVFGAAAIITNLTFYFIKSNRNFDLIPWGVILIFIGIQMIKKSVL